MPADIVIPLTVCRNQLIADKRSNLLIAGSVMVVEKVNRKLVLQRRHHGETSEVNGGAVQLKSHLAKTLAIFPDSGIRNTEKI